MTVESIKKVGEDFNYKLAKVFLDNTRLSILSLIVFLLIGGIATVAMIQKTTGFPSPEIKYAQVLTIYPGASSTEVEQKVTVPIEGAIKDVEGVKTFQSSSQNSVSSIFVTINDDANADSVRNKIDSAIRGVQLPEGIDAPKVLAPQFSGPDSIFAITGADLETIYETYSKFEKDLKQIPETSDVKPIIELEKKVVITLDQNKLQSQGITLDLIKQQIQSLGLAIPVVSGETLDGKNQSIVTAISGNTYEDLQNLTIVPGVKLNQIAKIDIKYEFKEGEPSFIAIKDEGKGEVVEALTFTVKSTKGTNLSNYNKKVEDLIKEYSEVKYYSDQDELKYDPQTKAFYELYSQSTDNDEQINDVKFGLWGGDLQVDNKLLAKLGWFLGGLQLVFIFMLLMVSWRAAIVAALSIPLSLMFSLIYLFVTGQDLNTLVLFSLVLVIGLVVDPALVVLESLQRKIDTGLDSKAAAEVAVRNVGSAIFMAMLTNIIVFVPFAVISGIMGQIFRYIPLTIVPAIIGSYIVPLIFLTWIGSKFLRPTKGKTHDEEKNLWPIARGVIKMNEGILSTHPFVRVGILLITLLVPIVVMIFYFGTGKVKQVQFASDDNSSFGIIQGTYFSNIPSEEHKSISKEILQTAINEKTMVKVFPYDKGLNYYLDLYEPSERQDTNATEIMSALNDKLEKDYSNKFFDIQASLLSVGPPAASYQVSMSVKTNDPVILKKAALDIRETLLNACFKNSQVSINSSCNGGEKIVIKVDDGYTNKDNLVASIVLKRDEAAKQGVNLFVVNQIIKQLFVLNDGDKLGTVSINGDAIDIYVESTIDKPTTVQTLSNVLVPTQTGVVALSSIADIVETNTSANILRVKGQNIGIVNARLAKGKDDQGVAALVTQAVVKYYQDNDSQKTIALGLDKNAIGQYSEGDFASFQKSFVELVTALGLAIVISYFVLAIFFKSFSQPVSILFKIPTALLGVVPSLALFAGGQLGFLEIIGLIILVGIIENVVIFLVDGAYKKIQSEGWSDKKAISHVSGLRFRPIILSTFTAVASLLPLAIFSQFYRSIAVVIMSGMVISGLISLITTPILFVFFRWQSRKFWPMKWWQKILYLFPITGIFYLMYLWWTDSENAD